MKQYKKKFHMWWWTTDEKPKGKDKSLCERTNRQDWRKEATKLKKMEKKDQE